MAILKGTGLEFPNSDLLTGVIGPNYVARWATGSMGSNNEFLNLEVQMPGSKSANSKYLIIAEANTDDTNQNSAGQGLRFWLETPNGSYWVNRQGAHEEYTDQGGDKYCLIHNMIIDDGVAGTTNNNSNGTNCGAETQPIVAGQTRKYRVYGHVNNNNINWAPGVGRTTGWKGYLCVIELDGSICS